MPRPTLTVIFEHQIVSRMTVSGPVRAGRLDDNDLVLADTSVSGHHGLFERTSQGWCYTDLGSSNGSLVAAGPRMAEGDVFVITEVTQILLGSTVLEFDPKGEVAENQGAGPTTVSFEGPASPDVQRRSGGTDGEDSAPAAPTCEPGQGNPEQAKRSPDAARQRAPEATTGWFEAARAEAPSGSAPTSAPGSALSPAYPEHAHQAPPARTTSTPLRELAKGSVPGTGRASGPVARPTRTPAPRQGGTPPAAPQPKTRPAVSHLPEAAAPTPRLLVVLGGDVATHTLDKTVNVLGRSLDCDVVVDDASISSQHAEISHEGGRWMVRDLGSTNGTRQGLIRLSEAQQLSSHTHLIVGVADLLFVLDEPADPSRPQPLDDQLFLSWLRRRRQITGAQAASALAAARARACTVGEVLVEQGVLSPGALTELSHNAALKPDRPGQLPGYIWGLIVVAVGAALAFAASG